MAVEILVYCCEEWGGRGHSLTAYNVKRNTIISAALPAIIKADKLALWDYTYNARYQTGDLISCRPANKKIGWNKKRRVLVRIENLSFEEMQHYVNASYNITVEFLGKTGELCQYKSRYKFAFPMVVGTVYNFQNLKDAQMVDKSNVGPIIKVVK